MFFNFTAILRITEAVENATDKDKGEGDGDAGNVLVVLVREDYQCEKYYEARNKDVGQDLQQEQAKVHRLGRYLVKDCAAASTAGGEQFAPCKGPFVLFNEVEWVSLRVVHRTFSLFIPFSITVANGALFVEFDNSTLHLE